MANKDPFKVVTGEVRMSYIHAFEPHAFEGGDDAEAKYSARIYIPKSDKDTLVKLQNAIKAVKSDEASIKKWGGAVPNKLDLPYYDGDAIADEVPEAAGCYYLNLKNSRKPGVIDLSTGQAIDNPTEFYSGCYGRASFRLFAYNQKGKKGIGSSLSNLCKTRDGEPLGAVVTSAEDDFAEFVLANAPQKEFADEEEEDPLAGL